MRAPAMVDDPDAVEEPLSEQLDDFEDAMEDHFEDAPPTGAPAASAEELFEPADEADDLQFMLTDGPSVFGRRKHGKQVYSLTFTHPGPKSIARGLCSPADITKDGWPVAQPRFIKRPEARTMMPLPSGKVKRSTFP